MRNINGNRRHGPQRRGAATVELALVAPLFLLLLAGIIEFGFAFRAQHALSNVARRGARAAAVDGSTTSTVVADVTNHCVQLLGVQEGALAVSVKVNGREGAELHHAVSGDEITVMVTIPFSSAGTGLFSSLLKSSSLSSTSTFERE